MPVQQTRGQTHGQRSRWCRLPRTGCSHRCSHRRTACKSRCRYLARHSPHGEAKNGRGNKLLALHSVAKQPFRCGQPYLRSPCRDRGNAPREIRTPTVQTDHKALNLARLPVPPQARGRASIEPGRLQPALDAVRTGRLLCEHMFGSRHSTASAGGLMVELNLTKRQQEIFDFIKRYAAKHGYPPTVRDIGKAVGLTSSSTVHAHLANLEKLGLLRRDPTKPRAIEVLVDKAKAAVGRRAACRSSARSPPVSRSSPRRTSRSTSRCRRSRAATTASSSCACRRLDEERRHPRGRLRGRASAGHGRRRRDRRGAAGARRRRSSASSRRTTAIRLQPENDALEPITRATSTSWAAWSACAGGSRDAGGAGQASATFADRVAGAVSGGPRDARGAAQLVLHEARTNGSTECPLCHARVRPAAAGAATPAGAECDGCGSRLS